MSCLGPGSTFELRTKLQRGFHTGNMSTGEPALMSVTNICDSYIEKGFAILAQIIDEGVQYSASKSSNALKESKIQNKANHTHNECKCKGIPFCVSLTHIFSALLGVITRILFSLLQTG